MVKVLVAIKLTIVNSSFKRHYPSFGSNKKSRCSKFMYKKFAPQGELTAHGAKGMAVYPQQFWKQCDTIVATSIPDGTCKTESASTPT